MKKLRTYIRKIMMQSIRSPFMVSAFLWKRLVLRRREIMQWQWNTFGLVMFGAGIGFSLFILTEKIILPRIFAATTPWTQTDWSGGTASGTVGGTVTTYESKSSVDVTTVPGEATLDVTAGWSGSYVSWGNRRKITFDNTTATLGTTSEALTNFPVLVKLDTGTDIDYTKTKDAGEDVRFTDSDGTVLSYEIERWNESGSSYVWVKVPQIDINSNTDYIYMYYGNSGATDGQTASAVWDSNFLGVWHANDSSSSTLIDSTTNGKHGTKQASNQPLYTSNGAIAGAQSYTQGSSRVGTTITTALTNFTVEVWFKDDGIATGYERLADKNYSSCFWFGRNSGTSSSWGGGVLEANDPYGVYVTLTDGQWHQISSVRSGTTHYVYGDGGSVMNSNTVSSAACSTGAFGIGGYGDGTTPSQWFGGVIDEVRFSSSARSKAWIAASYKSGTDLFSSYAVEESKLPSSGTLTSNILDAGYSADWGVLTYTSSGSGAVTVKVRTDSSSNMSGAVAWGSCSSIASLTDLSATDCVDDTDQYIQYQVFLTPSGASSPVFQDISIAFSASDQVVPPTNATSVDITNLANTDTWTNTEPTITWTAGADDLSGGGLAGYCIALDEVTITGSETSTGLDPQTTAGGLLNALNDGITNLSTCPYIVGPGNVTSINLSSISGLTLTTGKHYYLSIKAVDLAGNVFTGVSGTYQDLVDFKYDSTSPTNVSYISAPSIVFGNVADMNFSWPSSGGSVSSDAHSGVLGWQYSLDSGVTWRGPDTNATLGITYIDDDAATYSYTLTEGDDGGDISEGINTIYLRTVDTAGNYSSPSTYRTAPLNYGGAAPTFTTACDLTSGITITPGTSTSNSYALSWDAGTATGGNTVSSYYYMINTSPPSTLSSLESNSTQYLASTSTSVTARKMVGAVKGANTVYVVAVDSDDNYSQSNCLKGTFTLNSTLPDPVTSLSATDASIKSDELWRASVTWGVPTYAGTGTLTYVIQRSTDNSTFTEVTTTTGTSYTDTVPSSTTYYYRVGTYDTTAESIAAPTYTTSVSVYPKGTWDEAPTLSSGPTVTGITTKRATISWSTSRTADSRVQYGTSSGSYFDEEPSKSDKVTSHEIKLTNLSPGTKYYYKVKWTDEDGNTGASTEKTFTTDPSPVVKDVSVNTIGITTAIVTFTVTSAEKAQIYYGSSTAFGGLKEVSTSTTESVYSVQLTGLNDGTKYYFKINTLDSEDDEYEGTTLDFTTLPRPRISNILIEEVTGTAQPTVLVSWVTNTEISSIITYYPTGKTSDARDEVNVTLKTGTHRMVLRGLVNETRYEMQVKGRDKVGNEAISDIQTFTTATDTRPPQIENLKVEGSTSVSSSGANQTAVAQLVVSWDTDEPSTSQVEIGEGTGASYAQRSQEDQNMTTNHIVILSNLTPSKVYHLRGVSKDRGGNTGQSLDTVTITPKSTDSALDLVVGNLSDVFGFLRGL